MISLCFKSLNQIICAIIRVLTINYFTLQISIPSPWPKEKKVRLANRLPGSQPVVNLVLAHRVHPRQDASHPRQEQSEELNSPLIENWILLV
jgi:hypothetical protein